jgi:hypothetical protein
VGKEEAATLTVMVNNCEKEAVTITVMVNSCEKNRL